MVKALLGAIIVVFVFWGVGTFRTRQADILAKVNGEVITFTSYRSLYAQRMEQLQRMFRGQLNDELLRQLNVPQQVFEELVKRVLLEKVAQEIGVRVSPDEVRLTISRLPAFQNNGQFDPRRYQLLLRELRLTPRDFEEQVRAQILEAKIRRLFTSPIRATENEVKERYIFLNEKLAVEYVLLPVVQCAHEVQITEEEIKKYFEEHKERYRTPLKIKLAYYLLPFEEVRKALKISKEEIKEYYEAHKEEYHRPEERKLRHILISKKPGEDDEAFFKRAQKIRQMIKKPEDIARLAPKYSDDPHTKNKGGDLGFLKKGEVFTGLGEAVFSAKEGEILGPLRSPMGYHIILVEKIRPESYRSLDEVQGEIEKKLKDQRLKEVAWEKANKMYDQIILAGGLEAWAQKRGIKLEETPFFDLLHPPAGPIADPSVLEAAQKLEEGELGPLLDVGSGILIFKLLKRDEPHIPPLEEVKQRVEADLKREKAQELCGQKAKALLAALKKNKDWKALLEQKGLELQSKEILRKDLLRSGLPQPVAEALRGMGRAGQWYEEPIFANGVYYLVYLARLSPPDLKGLDKEKKGLLRQLTLQKRQEAFASWYEALRQKAEVKLYRKLPQI